MTVHIVDMDYARLASELLRALRARRSQPALARRLKYSSNVVYLWESGRAYPSFSRALEVAAATGVQPVQALRRFYGEERAPAWLDEPNADLGRLALWLLRDLRGGLSLTELARRTGFSRYAIGRWLEGDTAPRLPQALALVDACSLRVLDLVAAFVDPIALPSFAAAHADLLAARRAAHELPFSQVVLHCLELEAYRSLPLHEPGFIATRLGITREAEQEYLDALVAAGRVQEGGTHYEPTRIQTVDTRGDDHGAQGVRRYFATLAADRVADGGSAAAGYNVFAVSRQDYARIVALQRSYFTQLRAIVAASEPAQVVALASTQVMPLSDGG